MTRWKQCKAKVVDGKKPMKKPMVRHYNTVWVRGIKTLTRNMLLLKNPQFLPNNYGTSLKWPTHE